MVSRKTKKMILVETTFNKPVKEVLQELYQTKTMPEMVAYLREQGIYITQGTISQWFLRLGIEARSWQLPDKEKTA